MFFLPRFLHIFAYELFHNHIYGKEHQRNSYRAESVEGIRR